MPVLIVPEIKSIPHKGDYAIKNIAHKEHVDPHWEDLRCKNIKLLMSPNKTNLGDNSAFLKKQWGCVRFTNCKNFPSQYAHSSFIIF